MNIDLSDKVAVVTGAGRGIGREIALTLSREGVKVAATDVNPDLLGSLGREAGYTGRTYSSDVRNLAQNREVVQRVVDEFGRLDILVNNAGLCHTAPV